MADRIVFFNLADMHETGLVQSSAQSLQRKFAPKTFCQKVGHLLVGGVQVEVINLFALMDLQREARDATLHWSDRVAAGMAYGYERAEIKERCRTAKKILLGAHGKHDDTENLFKGLGWEKGSGFAATYEELATLTADLLTDGVDYKLSLIICYAARASEFRKDHEKDLQKADIETSLAFKFFKSLCGQTRAHVVMTARTGAVQFEKSSFGTGKSLVQTEEGVTAMIDLIETLKEPEYKDYEQKYQSLQNLYGNNNKIGEFNIKTEKMYIGKEKPVDDDEVIMSNKWTAEKKKLKVSEIEPQEKYGKFIYEHNRDGTISVYRKYPQRIEIYRG